MEKTIKYLENGEYHYATVRSVGDLAELKTNSKETLVEAINELWDGGGNADPSKAPKPEGYDQLVQDVADAVKNQQEISQQWIEWQNEEAQLTEERKQAYLQAMKEMQESIDKAKADAAALDDKTAKLDEQITKTFSDLDTNIQNMHEQLQKEADRMNQELTDTKSDLTKVRTDLQNAQLDNGRIHDELTNINGKFEHKVWQTDLDPLKEQIDRAETSVQQTKDELLGKASRQDLDTVTNTVSKLDTQLKETAKGVEISVKKDELGGEIAEALTNKTNILLGTRRFTTNNWQQREHVEICSDPWKGFLVAKQNSPIEGIQQAYDVKAGATYTFSLFAKMDNLDDSNKPQIILAKNNLDTSLDTKIDVWRKEIDDITSDFKRYDLTFTPSEDCTIYPHVISNSNNPIFVCGYQLEIGKTSTPWEPNQEDVGDYVEKSEAQFNVYNDKIQALTEKQRQQGDTQEKLKTEVTQTAEGTRQVSENLKKTNDDITKLRGEFEVRADHMKSEYETYTNKAIGQISDSTLNLIRNSSFQNKDEDFAQWQNVSAKANVRQDENGLRWVELTQSGLTTDNPQGVTSNYFNVKQGKVTVAVDIKSGDKANLDNESILFLELYNDVKKRVDFRFVTLSELGLSNSLLGDHQVHRGLYRLGIDRNDAKYMTVKAHLMRNGDLYFTNFSARLSSIDDGAYEPNPDDINQQILKQSTKIEQNAKEVAIKANSVDVTRDIKSAVENNNGGGVNLLKGTKDFRPDSIWFPLNAWVRTNDTYNDLTIFKGKSTEDWNGLTQYYSVKAGETYTFSLNARYESGSGSSALYIMLNEDPENGHKAAKVSPWSRDITLNENWQRYSITFTVNSDGYIKPRIERGSHNKNVLEICGLKLERGTVATPWTPASEDTSEEIKSAKDAAIQVASDQINIHVNELTTSFDDKLNKRVNEVKTASEKFTSDGIEQTVTKITNVKNDVDRLGDTVNGIQVGGRNLAVGTSNNWQSVSDFNGEQNKTIPVAKYIDLNGLEVGDILQIGITVKKTSRESGNAQWIIQADGNVTHWNSGTFVTSAEYNRTLSNDQVYKKEWQIKLTADQCKNTSWTPTLRFDYVPIGTTFYWKDFYVKKSKVSTDWSPAPEDINQQITNTNKKIDTQTLDSANIDQMKTQGHYFVRNLTGNPIGGWVYVDVIGNNNDRVRQDVYADQNNQHKYRSWNGSRWSDWEQGAYLSDVKTEVTASVNNLGDRVTTEVNSVETRVNNKIDGIQVGGRNILSNTENLVYKAKVTNSTNNPNSGDSMWKLAVGNLSDWLRNNPDVKEIAISYNYELQGATPTGTIRFGVNQAPAWEYMSGFNLQGKPAKGRVKLIVPVTDNMRETASNISRIRGDGLPIGATLIISHPKWEVGNKATDWSPAPEDTVEAIKELNTKWDVANGQIQGKVTATDVNNILNGKGYATQSWAQTMFQMKSDSITLQAVRDNITNGIQNQLNDTRNKLNNMQVGGRNYLQESDKLVTGWGQDLGTIPSEALNSLAGKTITVSADVEWNNFKSDGSKQNRLGFEASVTGSDGHGYWLGTWKTPTTASGKERISTQYTLPAGVTFTVNNNGQNGYVGINGSGKVSHVKIEVGNKATDWTPAPTDDVGTNLLKGTADFSGNWKAGTSNSNELWKHESWIDPNGNQSVFMSKRAWNGCYQPLWLDVGIYTFSCYYYISGVTKGASVYTTITGDNQVELSSYQKEIDSTKDKWNKAEFTFYVTKAGNSGLRVELYDANATLHIASYKLEKGSVATPWTPNPQDAKTYTDSQITNTNKKIDTQVLDSANVDDLKTQGHYFVKNLANSPIAGWVYVDVTGNNNDRLKQEVYQDNGYEHRSRRWTGSGWTEWTTDVNNKNVVSQINMTPDQVKIASKKIVIDGNTDIHGTLRVPDVKLAGRNGNVDLSGDGINITKTNGAGINIASNGIQLTANTNGQNEIEGVITTAWNMNNKNQNGIGLILTTEQELGRPYGGDILAIGSMPSLGKIHAGMVFDATGITPEYKKGFNWFAPHTLNGDGGVLRFPGAQDDLMLYPGNMPGSRQSDYSQPTLRLVHGNSQGSAGIQFQWDDIVPFGRITSSMSYVSAVGTDDDGGITVSWYSYGAWYGGRKAPSIVYRGSDGNRGNGGIVFYPYGEVCFWQGDFHSNLRWSGIKNTD